MFKRTKKPHLNSIKEAGNVFLMLFGAVGMVGVLGASTMTVMKGPVKTMSEVTKRTVAENSMIASGKLALIASGASTTGDCDEDGTIEGLEYGGAISGFTGGGRLPPILGAGQQDPWGRDYAYCAWDHGTDVDDAAGTPNCGGPGQSRLPGKTLASETEQFDQEIMAVISAGPDGVFQTTCEAYVDDATPLVNKTSGSDDMILSYNYGEATAIGAGLWSLSDPDTAEIQKDLNVRNDADTATTFQLERETGNLTLGTGATGEFPIVSTDNIQAIGSNTTINVDDSLELTGATTLDLGELELGRGNGNVGIASDIFITAQGLIATESNLYLNSDSDGNNTGDIYFSAGTETSGATRLMTILRNGNVGIGVTGPSAKLDVVGTTELNGNVTTTGTVYSLNGSGYGYFGSSASNYLRFDDVAVGNEAFMRLGAAWNYHFHPSYFTPYTNASKSLGTSGTRWQNGHFNNIVYGYASVRSPIFYDQDNTGFYLNPNSVSILNDIRPSIIYDRDNTGYYLNPNSVSRLNDIRPNIIYDGNNTGYYWNGDSTTSMNVVYANTYYHHSDENLKKNITTLSEERVNKLYDLRGVEYDWKEDDRHDIGFIAQELEKDFPELVSQMDSGTKGVKYANFVALLVEALKSQKKEIEANKQSISALEKKFQNLEKVLNAQVSEQNVIHYGDPLVADQPDVTSQGGGDFLEEIGGMFQRSDSLPVIDLDESVDVSNIVVPENPGEVCSKPQEVSCINDPESTDCADHVNSYIYESRVYALCVRGDQKLTREHEKSYKKMISKIQEASLAPVDTRLNYYNNSHVLAISGFLNAPLAKPVDGVLSPETISGPSVPATAEVDNKMGVMEAPVEEVEVETFVEESSITPKRASASLSAF